MRKKIVAGNWKMNHNLRETTNFIGDLKKIIPDTNTKVIIAPSFVNLRDAVIQTKKTMIEVVAQNMHFAKGGAYTGEVSSDMLKGIGIRTVILGHSERRLYFGETDKILKKKVNTAITEGFNIIFCFGEELKDRKAQAHYDVVADQLRRVIFNIEPSVWGQMVLAYEPVWAIGTGETASPEQAQDMHNHIRGLIADKYDKTLADEVSILYGGSVKPDNAKSIFSQPDVDGGLIGGASLKASDFNAIIEAGM